MTMSSLKNYQRLNRFHATTNLQTPWASLNSNGKWLCPDMTSLGKRYALSHILQKNATKCILASYLILRAFWKKYSVRNQNIKRWFRISCMVFQHLIQCFTLRRRSQLLRCSAFLMSQLMEAYRDKMLPILWELLHQLISILPSFPWKMEVS